MEKTINKEKELISKMKARRDELADLLEEVSSHWGYEDPVYRFYHMSFKVYRVQETTRRIAQALESIAPEGASFCPEFQEILEAGASGVEFEREHNRRWTAHTRPLLEAFFHARYFLEMAVKYAGELDENKPPEIMSSGWAALRSLFGIF